ncbi:anti-adapter protein IraD [Escherichia coli]|nr:anti-adapter protein IraD [Escherichia coli]
MMRQSVQTVLPESTGNNTLSLRFRMPGSFNFFSSPHSPLPILLVSGMPEWQGHNQSDKLLQSWYCRQLRSALLFHEPRIAALQVNLKAAYCHELAISLEMMLYHDDEPLTFDWSGRRGAGIARCRSNDGNAIRARRIALGPISGRF